MLIYSLINTFNATTTMNNIAPYADSMFQNFLFVVYIVVGFTVGGMILAFIIGAVTSAVASIFYSRNKFD